MKTWILAIAMITGVATYAQGGADKEPRPHHGRERATQLTPEQRSELKSKQLALTLDLNDKQQNDVKKLLLDREAKWKMFAEQRKAERASGKKPTTDERFAMRSKILDEQIALKRDMKKILTPEQYVRFEKIKSDQHGKRSEKFRKIRNARR